MRRLACLVLNLVALAACSPALQPLSDTRQAPALVSDAVIARDGYRLPLRVWRAEPPERAIAIALHGFNDYSNAWDASGTWWAAHGVTVYAYDQRGFGKTDYHGIWPGVDPLVHDVEDATLTIRARHPGVPLFLIGESMGAAVIMAAMADGAPPRVNGVVLGAPAVWGRDSMNELYRAGLWLGLHVMPWNPVTGDNLGFKPTDNIEMLKALGRDPLVIKRTRIDTIGGLVDLMDTAEASAPEIKTPALVLYGAKDELIPRTPIEHMAERLGDPHRMVVYKNGWHMLFRDLQQEVVWRDVLAWMLTPNAPLPSGEERNRLPLFADR
ncbi:MAG TPA: alpha/beta hydrolase [Candidatus Cybelea sp.]|nr:alpha/beta hydrolase [Candidatus Cybelea sp.]